MTAVRPPIDCLLGDYARHAKKMPVSPATVRAYVYGARLYIAWLAEQTVHDYHEVVTDPMVATHAVRDFRRYMLRERKAKPKTVDTALSGIASLYAWLGMPRPDVRGAASRTNADDVKSLDEDQLRAVLRAAERRGIRDHAIVVLMYATGTRLAETAAIDVDDLALSDRRGLLTIRAGKGDKQRKVPLTMMRPIQVLNRWVKVRHNEYDMPIDSGPLFITSKGDRLSTRTIHHTLSRVGEAAGVELTAHMLRHTFGRNLIDTGTDVPTVAGLLGHAKLETTMIYTRPRDEHREAAVNRLAIDY